MNNKIENLEPFEPSRQLCADFLKASDQFTQEFQKSLSFIPAKFFTSKPSFQGNLIDKVYESLARTIHGALEEISLQAAAFGEDVAPVSNARGEFVDTFSRTLAEFFPISIYDLPNLLKKLYKEFEFHAQGCPRLDKWGSLHMGVDGLFLKVFIILPPKPPLGGVK